MWFLMVVYISDRNSNEGAIEVFDWEWVAIWVGKTIYVSLFKTSKEKREMIATPYRVLTISFQLLKRRGLEITLIYVIITVWRIRYVVRYSAMYIEGFKQYAHPWGSTTSWSTNIFLSGRAICIGSMLFKATCASIDISSMDMSDDPCAICIFSYLI